MSADTLRPSSWDEYIGQERLKRELEIRISAALQANRPLEHLLLVADPGAGKTALASIVGAQLGDDTELVMCPVTQRALSALIRRHDGVLVLDEIHRQGKRDSEILLPLLESNYLPMTDGRKIEAGWLTVIGCTTEPQLVIKPLWDRFGSVPVFEEYSEGELALIVQGMARKAGLDVTVPMAEALGRAALGTPRRARQLVLGYRDLLQARDRVPTIDEVCELCQVSLDGLSIRHLQYMQVLDALGGTKGLKVIAALLRLAESVVEDLERPLILRGLLDLTASGRELTPDGYNRLKMSNTTTTNAA